MFKEILGRKYDAYLGFIRKKMIADQIEARGVKDPRVLAAMEKVCRHCFVPEDLVTRAYEDYPLPIGLGQTVSQPYIVALMSELLDLKGGETVLEIGTGSGYQTAVLAELAAKVNTVEFLPDLSREARVKLEKLGYRNIAIIATCAAAAVPRALTDQLKEGGRLVIPAGPEGVQTLKLLRKTAGEISEKDICQVRFVPLLTPPDNSAAGSC